MTDTPITTPADALEAAARKIVAEVQETERTHTRNGWTDFRCRQFLVDFGEQLLAALAARIAAPVAQPSPGSVAVCAICDIAGCHHIREVQAQPAPQAQAEAVAGAYLAAAAVGEVLSARSADDIELGVDLLRLHEQATAKALTKAILALTPADAQAALAQRDAEVRRTALREAADKVLDRQGRKALGTTEGNAAYDSAMSDAYHTILALIDKEPAR